MGLNRLIGETKFWQDRLRNINRMFCSLDCIWTNPLHWLSYFVHTIEMLTSCLSLVLSWMPLLGPEQVSTCEAPMVSNDHFFIPNDRIFHCLNMPQNSPNSEYRSALPKNVIIYRRPWFPPLGGAIIEESAFSLKTHIYFVVHSKTLYPLVHWIVLNLDI